MSATGKRDFDAYVREACTRPHALGPEGLARLLAEEDPGACETLFAAARTLKREVCGCGIAVRGLVEAGNVCAKDCYYCGIRKSNAAVRRYSLSADEIYAAAERAKAAGYASLVIQSGECESAAHTQAVLAVLDRLRPLDMGITLSLGEQTAETYAHWREAGATRYLLRMETTRRSLYEALHPATCSFSRRLACLEDLRALGYQVGTGVMCALPGQTHADLARDIVFFGACDADMIGMGPYIAHPDTPLAPHDTGMDAQRRLLLALKMIAVARLYLHDVNIAASTALEALSPDGRLRGILAGANVVMPNVTPALHRADYGLYAGKPVCGEAPEWLRGLSAAGEHLLLNVRGDSLHFNRRTGT